MRSLGRWQCLTQKLWAGLSSIIGDVEQGRRIMLLQPRSVPVPEGLKILKEIMVSVLFVHPK